MEAFRDDNEDELSGARREANSWLSRLDPIVNLSGETTPKDLERHLKTLRELSKIGPGVLERLTNVSTAEDSSLLTTLRSGQAHLSIIEEGVRSKLAALQPGHAQGQVDLDRLSAKLTEIAAHEEMDTSPLLTEPLKIQAHQGSVAAAMGIGVFGMGWTAFTTFHAFLMIGGMFKSFGFVALFLLLFYSIFFLVGFGMLAGAWHALWTVDVEIEGDTLRETRSFRGMRKVKTYRLTPNTEVEIGYPKKLPFGISANNKNPNGKKALVIRDPEGWEYTMGLTWDHAEKKRRLAQIEARIRMLSAR